MTRQEYFDVMDALEAAERQEKRYCARYIELNPQDADRRRRDADLVLYGLMRARQEIKKRLKID